MNAQALLAGLRSRPEQVVAFDQDVPKTAESLLHAVSSYYARIVSDGGRWALYFEDSFECAAAVLAVWLRGGQPCLAPNNLPATCKALEPQVSGFLGDFQSAAPSVSACDVALPEVAAESLAQAQTIAFFTSGSSGDPQCIEKQARQLFNEVATLESCFGQMLGNALVVSSVSHQHIYGFLFRLLWPLVCGRPFASDSLRYAEALSSYSASQLVWVSSPTHLTRLPPNLTEPRLSAVFSSGAPLPRDASEAAAAMSGAEVIEVFGSTETGGIGWRCQHKGEQHWRIFPGLSVQVDEQETLLLRSPHLQGDQWYRCADRVRIESEGLLLLGRADRIVKVEGKRVSLEQLEATLLAFEQLKDVRIESVRRQGRVAVRDELMVIAVLSAAGASALADDRNALIAMLKNSLAGLIERPLLPRRWRFVEQLPRNSQGKLEKQQLQLLMGELLMEKTRD